MWTSPSLIGKQSAETVVLFIVSYVLAWLVIAKVVEWNSRKTPPPGPWAWPIVGNLPAVLSGGQPHQALARFARRYGPIMGISLGPGPRIVVLTSLSVVKEMLVKNADSTSDRRVPPLLDLAFSTKGSVIWENGHKWMSSRRTSISALRRSLGSSSTFGTLMRSSLHNLRISLHRYKDRPCNPRSEITSAIAEIICSLCFGHCLDVRSNPKIADIMRVLHSLSRGLSGISLGHIFPQLYWTPLYRKLRHDFNQYKQFLEEVVEDHKLKHRESDNGIDGDDDQKESITDVTDYYLNQIQNGGEVAVEEGDIWRMMFDLLGAGTETTSETLLWGILYLCLFPEIQRQVHAEIDQNITLKEPDDVITYDRRKLLPYTQATILELLRCSCVAPLSLPRVTSSDVTLLGYSIPKGTEIWVNEWAINRDQNVWSKPEDFDPTRFLDASGQVDPKRKDLMIAFGEGRRMCLGRCLAERMLFEFLSNILRCFAFRLPDDCRAPPNVNEGNFGLTYSPPPFEVIITARDRV